MSEWTPKNGDIFYWIDSTFTVNRETYVKGYRRDQERVEVDNCFRTYDDAVEAVEKFKSISKDYRTIKQKPKLTVEVFDREDYPEWARWAAVDPDGSAFYYEVEPHLNYDVEWVCNAFSIMVTSGSYDSEDWEHSLIKRPKKVVLPDWVKPDAIGWNKFLGYFKVTTVGTERVSFANMSDSIKGTYSLDTILKECREARCIVDAVDLVGKKVRFSNGVTVLITRYDPNTNRVDFGGHKEVPICQITESQHYQLIGEVKFKYQHMENGEWVD